MELSPRVDARTDHPPRDVDVGEGVDMPVSFVLVPAFKLMRGPPGPSPTT